MTSAPCPAVVASGRCPCGAVRFDATLAEGGMDACHCTSCLKVSAGPQMLAHVDSLVFAPGAEPATWRASDLAERMFCASCGATVGFRTLDGAWMGVGAFLFDPPLALTLEREVFHDVKPDAYAFAGRTGRKTRAEILGELA